jgi:hypothetical protein
MPATTERPIPAPAVPPRITEAGQLAEAVLAHLQAGAPAVVDNRSYELRDQARSRQRTFLRGLRSLEAFDITTHLRQHPADGRWRVYCTRATLLPGRVGGA